MAQSVFDYQRQQAAQSEKAALQGQKDAMARRKAQLGGGPGGALLKSEQVAEDQSARRLADTTAGINAQEQAVAEQRLEAQKQREYGTSERLGAQSWQTGERVGSQGFQKDLQQAQISSTEGMQAKQIASTEGMQEKQITSAEGMQAKELSSREKMQQLQIGSDEKMTLASLKSNEKIANQANKTKQTEINNNFVMAKAALEEQVRSNKISEKLAQDQFTELVRQYDIDTAANDRNDKYTQIINGVNSGLEPEELGGLLEALGYADINIPDVTFYYDDASKALAQDPNAQPNTSAPRIMPAQPIESALGRRV